MCWGLAAILVWLAAGPLGAQVITSAQYNEPTTRYPHGVLGDNEEWGNLDVVVRTEKGKKGGLVHTWLDRTYNLRLPKEMVFEDIAPRLVNLDGVEGPEIVVVESHQDLGARLAVYGLNADGVPALRSWTNFIGTPNRWLAPIGAADFDGDGTMDIALIDRPHLAHQLILLRYAQGELPSIRGFSPVTNHRIGDDFITGGVRHCAGQPEMIVLDPDWSLLIRIRWQDGRLKGHVLGPYEGQDSVAAKLACK